MQKKFISNLALLLLLNLLIKPFWILGIDRAVQNAVPPMDYGLFYALFNFSFLFNIFLDFGITNFNNKNISQNNHLLAKHLSSIVLLRLMLAVFYFIVTIIAGLLIGYEGKQLNMLLMLSLNQFLASMILYLRSNLAGLHLFKTDSIISVMDRLMMIGFCSLLLWGGVLAENQTFQIEWYIYCQTLAYVITTLITLFIVFDKARTRKLKWNYSFFLLILKKSYPYAILVLLMTFYNRIDAVMLERMLPDGKTQSAIYASAYRLLDSANMIAYLFAGLLLPMFSKMIKQKHSTEALVRLSFSLLASLSFTVSIISWMFSTEIMKLLYEHEVEEASTVFALLMICFVCISTTYIFGTLLTANGNLKELNIMAASGMALNIIFNLYLIPEYKAAGSAVSSLLTQCLTAFAQVLLAQKIFRFKLNFRFLLALFTFIVCLIGGTYFIQHQIKLNWIWQIALSCTMAGLLAFTLRIVDVKKLIYELKYGS